MNEVTAEPRLPKPSPRLSRFCDSPSWLATRMVSIPMRTAPKKKYPMGKSSHGHPTRNACCAPNEKKNIAVALPNSTRLIAGMGQRWLAGTRSIAKLSICSSMDAAGPRNLSRMSSRLMDDHPPSALWWSEIASGVVATTARRRCSLTDHHHIALWVSASLSTYPVLRSSQRILLLIAALGHRKQLLLEPHL